MKRSIYIFATIFLLGSFFFPAISGYSQENEEQIISLEDEVMLIEDIGTDQEEGIQFDIGEDPDLSFGEEQEGQDSEPETQDKKKEKKSMIKKIVKKTIPSLFFTYWQHKAILDAKNSEGSVRPPTQFELEGQDNDVRPEPGERNIGLGGIVFSSDNDWTIWINGERVTPRAIPEEVLDLKVFKEYIEIKWLDDYTNQIFPLRLRPHQRFNMDSRIFLPG